MMYSLSSLVKINLLAVILQCSVFCSIAMGCDVYKNIDFKGLNKTVFDGFGVQIWETSDFKKQRDELFRRLSIHFVRFGIDEQIKPEFLQNVTTSDQILEELHREKDGSDRSIAFKHLADDLRYLNISVHGIVWQMPSIWRFDSLVNAKGAEVTFYKKANTVFIDKYSKYVVAQLRYAISLGFRVNDIEITNEPEGLWNTRWEPMDYARLVHLVRTEMNDKSLSYIGIEGPGNGLQRDALPYLRALKLSGFIRDLDFISAHDWDSRNEVDIEGVIPDFSETLSHLNISLPIHITEFNDEHKIWDFFPLFERPSKRTRRANIADTRIYGLETAASVLKLIVDGASEIFLWQMQDLEWGTDSLGLIDMQGRIRPSGDALKVILSNLTGIDTASGLSLNPESIAAALANKTWTRMIFSNLSSCDLHINTYYSGRFSFHKADNFQIFSVFTPNESYNEEHYFIVSPSSRASDEIYLTVNLPPLSIESFEIR